MAAPYRKSNALWEKMSRDESDQLYFAWDAYRSALKRPPAPGEHMFSDYCEWVRLTKSRQESLTDAQREYINQFIIDYTADILIGA